MLVSSLWISHPTCLIRNGKIMIAQRVFGVTPRICAVKRVQAKNGEEIAREWSIVRSASYCGSTRKNRSGCAGLCHAPGLSF
jgi:hypothetical protein